MGKLTKQEDKLRKAIIQGYERLYRSTGIQYEYVTLKMVQAVLEAIGEPPDDTCHLDHIYPVKAFIDHHSTTPLTLAQVMALNSPENLRWLGASENMSKQARHDSEGFKEWISKFR